MQKLDRQRCRRDRGDRDYTEKRKSEAHKRRLRFLGAMLTDCKLRKELTVCQS